jgi:hypothetical protein
MIHRGRFEDTDVVVLGAAELAPVSVVHDGSDHAVLSLHVYGQSTADIFGIEPPSSMVVSLEELGTGLRLMSQS